MLPLLLYLSIYISVAFSTNTDEDCVQLWLRQKPDLARRFSTEQIRWMCQRTNEWMLRALNPSATSTDDIITPSQREYLTKLRQCKGSECINLLNGGGEPRPTPNVQPALIRTRRAKPRTAWGNTNSNNNNNAPGGRPVQRQDQGDRAYRKEIRMMNDEERRRYFNALNRMKKESIDGMSKYDLHVIFHTPEEAPGAHWGPAFLPYHRELLKQFEIALRQIDRSIALPYWDSTLDEGLPSPKDSILWTNDFFGNGDNVVRMGPFANWSATHELSAVPGMRRLYRDVGNSQFGGMYKQEDIQFILNRQSYADLTACLDPTFELVHGLVHMFVGGYMSDIGISPNDPTFFHHHTFIDYLWEQFRQSKQGQNDRESGYPSDDQACNNFHYAEATMRPFTIKNKEGLSNRYTRELYFYQPSPTCSSSSPSCVSQYLFCDTRNNAYRCLSKVKIGGVCTGFEGSEICYKGQCRNGMCYASTNPETTQPTPRTTRPTPTSRPIPTTRPTAATRTTRRPNPTTYPTEPPFTYLPPPPRPPVTDNYNVIPEFPIVWFTCTVQKGTDSYGVPPTDVTVRTRGLNMPVGYTQTLNGQVFAENSYPYYNGAAVLQVKDPKSGGYMAMTEFSMDAFDSNGRQCSLLCYSNTRRQYGPCNSNRFKVSTNSYYSDPIKFSESQLTALESQWVQQNGMNSRAPDYCMFQCP